MSRIWALVALALIVVATLGCSQKIPATDAIAAAEQALADIHEPAMKYVPDKYAKVKADLEIARKAFAEENYPYALAAAELIPAKAKELGEAAAAAQEALAAELKVEWAELAETMPGQLANLTAKVTELDQAKQLPKGIARDTVEQAKSGLALAEQAWNDANVAYDAGNFEGAVARARASEQVIANLMIAIGMTSPAAGTPAG
jgi:hypothetical protein